MIRVFSFVASCAGEKSRTARYSDALAAVLEKKAQAAGECIQYTRMTGADLRIEFCRSCRFCFTKGVCPLDNADDMPSLKQRFLESDIIFFGTPVYMSDMSGLAKCVIDRISYWAHRYDLAGKVGVAFATTSTTFGQMTAEHLSTLLSYTGLTMVHPAHAVTSGGPPNLYVDRDMAPALDTIADELLLAWRDPALFVTPQQEVMLASRNLINKRYRRFADLIGEEPWNETLVCEARRIADYASFSEMAAQMKGRSWEV